MFWDEVPERVDQLVIDCGKPAWDIKRACADVYTQGDVGYYFHPERHELALFPRRATEDDRIHCKAAATRAVGQDHVRDDMLSLEEVSLGKWVKVAYSPTLRKAMTWLNFFPGKYPGGIPNAPSPLAATLTSGLVGAGLGYGTGWLAEKLMPKSWGRGKLRRTLAMLGGLGGATPGALWMIANAKQGKGVMDPSLLSAPAGSPPQFRFKWLEDVNDQLDREDLKKRSSYDEAHTALEDVPLGNAYKSAVSRFCKGAFDETGFGAMSFVERRPPTPLDVNINTMGHTLWDVGASPGLTATTMGAVHAASQMPGGIGPNFATPQQFGSLSSMMGSAAAGGVKGGIIGHLVGGALGALTNLPPNHLKVLRNSGAALGVINAVVPKLFGR